VAASIELEETVSDAFRVWRVETAVPAPFQGWEKLGLIVRNGQLETFIDVKEDKEFGVVRDTIPRLGYGLGRNQNYRGYLCQSRQNFEEIAESGLLHCDHIGKRIRLTWEKCESEDFWAYKIYWDAGLGGDPTIELYEINDREETEYITEEELEAGTYKFLLVFEDRVGNECGDTEPSSVKTIVLVTPPDMPAVTHLYNQTTRKLELTITTTDIVVVFSNFLVPHGMMNYAQFLHKYPIIHVSGVSYTSLKLWEGVWEFRVFASDKYGNYSDPEIIRFELKESGDDLVEVVPIETELVLEAELAAAAHILLSWYPLTPALHSVEIWKSLDGEAWALENTTTGSSYDFAGLDATEYWFKVRLKNVQGGITVYGPFSNIVEETADGAAPVGSQVLEGEIL